MDKTQRQINAAFDEALDRLKLSKIAIAERLNTSQSAISNWVERGIPASKLFEVINVLQDFTFTLKVFEICGGVKMLSDKQIKESVYARYFSQKKEEGDRSKLDEKFIELTGKCEEDRTDDDREWVKQHYIKELDEEIEEENSFKASILDDWKL